MNGVACAEMSGEDKGRKQCLNSSCIKIRGATPAARTQCQWPASRVTCRIGANKSRVHSVSRHQIPLAAHPTWPRAHSFGIARHVWFAGQLLSASARLLQADILNTKTNSVCTYVRKIEHIWIKVRAECVRGRTMRTPADECSSLWCKGMRASERILNLKNGMKVK